MTFEHTDYRAIMLDWKARKEQTNPRFSLRSMAKYLELNPSYLSQVLRRQKNFSASRAEEVATRMGLGPEERLYFCELVRGQRAGSEVEREQALQQASYYNPKREVTQLNVDAFQMIAQWYHIAILEMLELQDFNFNARNVASRLGITSAEAELAIDRLARQGLIAIDRDNQYRKTYKSGLFATNSQNMALRRYHRKMLEKAMEALGDSNEEKYIGSRTMAIDPRYIPEAKKLIREFKANMSKLLERGERKTQTYHLILGFFNLTNKGGRR